MTEPNENPWFNGKVLTLLALSLTLLTAFVTHEIDLGGRQQKQDDRLENIERRVEILENIADTNTKGRVRLETQMDAIMTQHADMLANQRLMMEQLQSLKRK